MLLYLRVIGLQLGLCKPGRVFIFNNPSHDLLYDPTDKKKMKNKQPLPEYKARCWDSAV